MKVQRNLSSKMAASVQMSAKSICNTTHSRNQNYIGRHNAYENFLKCHIELNQLDARSSHAAHLSFSRKTRPHVPSADSATVLSRTPVLFSDHIFNIGMALLKYLKRKTKYREELVAQKFLSFNDILILRQSVTHTRIKFYIHAVFPPRLLRF